MLKELIINTIKEHPFIKKLVTFTVVVDDTNFLTADNKTIMTADNKILKAKES